MAILTYREVQAVRGLKVPLVHVVTLGLKDLKEVMVHLEPWALLDNQAPLECKGNKVSQV